MPLVLVNQYDAIAIEEWDEWRALSAGAAMSTEPIPRITVYRLDSMGREGYV